MQQEQRIYDLIIAAVENEKRCDKLLLIFDVDLFLQFRSFLDENSKQDGCEIEFTNCYCLVITPRKRVTMHYILNESLNIYYPEEFYIAKIKEKYLSMGENNG